VGTPCRVATDCRILVDLEVEIHPAAALLVVHCRRPALAMTPPAEFSKPLFTAGEIVASL